MDNTYSYSSSILLGRQKRNRSKRKKKVHFWQPIGGWPEVPTQTQKSRPLGPFTENKSKGDVMWIRNGFVNPKGDRHGTMSTTYYRFQAEATGEISTGGNVEAMWSSARFARIKSIARCNARLFDAMQKTVDDAANAAMTAAELGKSANMVAQAAQRIGNLAVAILTRNPKRIANALGRMTKNSRIITDRKTFTILHGDGTPVYETLKGGVKRIKTQKRWVRTEVKEQTVVPSKMTPQDLWLELQFGWKPLLDDIHKSVEVLTRPRPQPYFAAVFAGATTNLEGENFGKFSASSSTRMKSKFSITMVDDRAAWQKQMGLTNPLLVAWDLVPFSFVVDWFGHVNKYLQGLDAFSGLQINGSSFSKTYGSCSGEIPNNLPPYHLMYSGSFFECARFGLPTNGSITDRFEVPGLDTWKAITSVALAMQQLARIK